MISMAFNAFPWTFRNNHPNYGNVIDSYTIFNSVWLLLSTFENGWKMIDWSILKQTFDTTKDAREEDQSLHRKQNSSIGKARTSKNMMSIVESASLERGLMRIHHKRQQTNPHSNDTAARAAFFKLIENTRMIERGCCISKPECTP
jgi:hypothetical protein